MVSCMCANLNTRLYGLGPLPGAPPWQLNLRQVGPLISEYRIQLSRRIRWHIRKSPIGDKSGEQV
jgi:hypothetical protein